MGTKYSFKGLHKAKYFLYPLVIPGLVLGAFVATQKNKSPQNPFYSGANAISCVPEFTDTFNSDKSKILAGSSINTTVNGENYTTDGTLGNLAMINDGNPGVRLRNFYDPMRPNARPGGYNYADVWNIYLAQHFVGDSTNAQDNGFWDAKGTRTDVYSGSTRIGYNTFTTDGKKLDVETKDFDMNKLNAIGNNSYKQNGNTQVAYLRGDNGRGLVIGGVVTGYKKLLSQVTHSFPTNTFNSGNFVAKVKYNMTLEGRNRDKEILGIKLDGLSSKNPRTNIADGFTYAGSYGLANSKHGRQHWWGPNIKLDSAKVGVANSYDVLVEEDSWIPFDLTTMTARLRDFAFKYIDPDNDGTGQLIINEASGGDQTLPNVKTNWEKVTGFTFLNMHFNDYGYDPIPMEVQYSDVRIDWSTKGQIDSVNIDRPVGGYKTFDAQADLPGGTGVIYQVINASNGAVIRNITPGSSLADITFPQIRLRALLNRNDIYTKTPTLKMWKISCGGICSNMTWQNGTKNISLKPGDTAVLTLTGTPSTLSGTSSFDFFDMVDINNGAPYTKLQPSLTSNTNSGVATVNVSYQFLQSLGKKSFQVNGVVPGGQYDAKCVVYVTLLYPPLVVGTPIVACTTVMNPYSLNFSITTRSQENSIRRNKAFLLPKNPSGPPSILANYAATPSIILDTSLANTSIGNGATYTRTAFSSAPQTTWAFNLTFDKNQGGYSAFYDKGGFDLYLYIEDATTNNMTVSGGLSYIPKVAIVSLDPLQDCARPYYKTLGGDYRSNEKSNYFNANVTIKGASSNKFWQPTTPWGSYKGVTNNNSAVNQAVSSYSAEIVSGAQNCTNTTFTSLSGFCSNIIDGPGVNHNEALSELGKNIDNGVITLRTLNKIDVNNQQNNVPKTISATLAAVSVSGPIGSRTATINIGALNNTYTPLLIDIPATSGITNIIINDDAATNPASIDNVIVWCRTASCVMHVNSVKSFAQGSISMSGPKLAYPSNQTNLFAKAKGRLFLNYNAPTELASTSAARKVYLEGGNASNYYLGAILTDGYLFGSQGTSTDIIKGFVLARGIVVRDNGNNTGDANRNKYTSFRDYPNPFLYIDYDAKYLLTFRGLLVKPVEDVERKYIGL